MEYVTPLLIGLMTGLLAGVLLMGFLRAARSEDPLDVDSSFSSGYPAAVDPWSMQAALMDASRQDMPDQPTLTNGALLYAALTAEEGAETYLALWIAIRDNLGSLPEGQRLAIQGIELVLAGLAERMARGALSIRHALASAPEFRIPLGDEHAVPLFDGVTDGAVTNCGLALALGLPGAEGYLEVAGSNLSKRNPHTLIIDKTDDGKWIKGKMYCEPDLARVLREHRPA